MRRSTIRARADRRGKGSADAGPFHRRRPAAAHVRHAVLHRRAVADGIRRKAVSPPDDRPGHRLGDHRAGARRPFRRIGRRRPARSPASCGIPPISMRWCRAGWLEGTPDDQAGGGKLSDEDRIIWTKVARTARPLKGKPPLPADEPQADDRAAHGQRCSTKRRRPLRRRAETARAQVTARPASLRPADARQARQGPPADRRARRPARHDAGRGAWPAAVVPAPGARRRAALCPGDHRQGCLLRQRRRPEARRSRLAVDAALPRAGRQP